MQQWWRTPELPLAHCNLTLSFQSDASAHGACRVMQQWQRAPSAPQATFSLFYKLPTLSFHWSICRSYALTPFNSSLSHSVPIPFSTLGYSGPRSLWCLYRSFLALFFSSSFPSEWYPCSVLNWVTNSHGHKLCSAMQVTSLSFDFLSEFSQFNLLKPKFSFYP